MKIPKTAKAISHIDDDLISEANDSGNKSTRIKILKWGSIAACIVAVIVAGAIILPNINNKIPTESGRYKDNIVINTESGAIIIPWEYLTDSERYNTLKIDGTEYRITGNGISEQLLGDALGTFTATGYDEISDKAYTRDFDAYTINNVDKSEFVAVKINDEYFVYKKESYSPPATLGELFALVDLPQVITLDRFSDSTDSRDSKYYSLKGDKLIWEVLQSCDAAPFVENDNFHSADRELLSFTVTSEALGIYKKAMYITKDGYLWTNAFEYQYLFNIGTDAAERIISYAKENCNTSEYEPYYYTVCGTVTEITEEFILVNDSILCKNPAEGVTFKIMLNSSVSPYITCGVIKINDTVQISYTEKQNENTIDSAVLINKADITDKEIYIAE